MGMDQAKEQDDGMKHERLHGRWNVPLAAAALSARVAALTAVPLPKVGAAAVVAEAPAVSHPTTPPSPRPQPIDQSRFEDDLLALMGSKPPASEPSIEPATLPMPGSRVGIHQMRDACCRAMAVDPQEIAGVRRHPAIVAARELFAWSAHRCCRASYPEIARAIGRRNHSTVHCAAMRFVRRADRDELVARAIDALPADVQPTNIGGRSAGRRDDGRTRIPSVSTSHGRGR